MARRPAARPLPLIMATALLASCAAEEPPPPAEGPAVVSLNRTFEAGRRSNGESAFLARQDLRLAFSDIDTIVTGVAGGFVGVAGAVELTTRATRLPPR